MLKGFEDITNNLTEHEETILAPMILSKFLCHKGQCNAIKNRELIEYCRGRGENVTEPRIRKIVEFIRQKNLLEGLIAKKFGYFIAETPEEILTWIGTMKQRRKAIDRSITSALCTVRKMEKNKQQYLL